MAKASSYDEAFFIAFANVALEATTRALDKAIIMAREKSGRSPLHKGGGIENMDLLIDFGVLVAAIILMFYFTGT